MTSSTARAALAHSLPLARLLNHTADALQAVRAGRSLRDVLTDCPDGARPGTQALTCHVLRWLGSAQAVRELLAPKAPPPAIDALLTSALALLWPEGGLPYSEHTLVDQAVRAGRDKGPFINAVLRRFLREREDVMATIADQPQARWNHPVWWIEHVRKDWPQQWQAVLTANNQRPPMTLRINARKSNVVTYVVKLAQHGIEAHAIGKHAVVLKIPRPVSQIPGFAQGEVSVQDLAAQMAAPLLIHTGLRLGARVLDACAAPGGKTAHLLELADLDVLAIDKDKIRLARVQETLTRLGLCAQVRAADAGHTAGWWDGVPFDAILLDAPCSASGIVRRHPDVRWLRRPSDVEALVQTQARLLDTLWPVLKPGGRLLYCTCSVFKAEGQDQIDAFLRRQPGALPLSQAASPGHLLPLPDNARLCAAGELGVAPDGFFFSVVQKDPR